METFAEYAEAAGFSTVPWEDDDLALELVGAFYLAYAAELEVGRRRGEPMVLDVHLIDSVGFNAFAGSFADADVVALFRDVPLLILKVARAMISHGLILPHIKTPDIDVEPVVVPGRLKDLFGAVRVWEQQPLNDPRREMLANRLAFFACLFVMAHEFSHIYNGHIDYLEQHQGLPLIAEIGAAGLPSPANYERETMEWDADAMASQRVLQLATEAVPVWLEGRTAWIVPDRNGTGTRDDAIQLALIAQSICGLFFTATDRSNPIDAAPRTHPHPSFRFATMLSMIPHTLSYRTGTASEEFLPILEPVFDQFHSSVAATFPEARPADDGSYSAEEFFKAWNDRTNLYGENWKVMYPELDGFKRGGVLAPADPHPHPGFPSNTTLG